MRQHALSLLLLFTLACGVSKNGFESIQKFDNLTLIGDKRGDEPIDVIPDRPKKPLKIEEIATSPEDGFFALKKFKGQLFAGGFGYQGKNKLFFVEPWREPTRGINVGESICAFIEFNGWLYANTEDGGKIFRSQDGESWDQVFDGPNPLGCGLAVQGEYLYALNSHYQAPSGAIYRSKDGLNWQQVYNSGNETLYIREIISYKSKLYAFAVARDMEQPGMLISTNGESWNWQESPARMFRGHIKGGLLWLTSSKSYSKDAASGIWTFDGVSFNRKYSTTNYGYVSNVISFNDALVALTTVEWKGYQGGAASIYSCDDGQTWQKLAEFEATEAWAIEVYNSKIYIGTKQDGGGGKLYRISNFTCD